MEDIAALALLSWMHDRIEDRWGRSAAWLITFTAALLVLTAAALVLYWFIHF